MPTSPDRAPFHSPRFGRCAEQTYGSFLDANAHKTDLTSRILCAVVRVALERRVPVIEVARGAGLPRSTVDNIISRYPVQGRHTSPTVAVLVMLAKWANLSIIVNDKDVIL